MASQMDEFDINDLICNLKTNGISGILDENTSEPTNKLTKNTFKLPITYSTHEILDDTICCDIDLYGIKSVESADTDNTVADTLGVYGKILSPKSKMTRDSAEIWANVYSTDGSYIKDTQRIIGSLSTNNPFVEDRINDTNFQEKLYDRWADIGGGGVTYSFLEKYNYISPVIFRGLNNNSSVLQIINLYILSSPLMSLIFPIISMIFPFLILRMRGVSLSIATYFDVLKGMLSNHPIGGILGQISTISWDKLVYVLFTIGMYAMQIISNIRTCIRYYSNLTSIHDDIRLFREFAEISIGNIDCFTDTISTTNCKSSAYMSFVNELVMRKNILEDFISNSELVSSNSNSYRRYADTGMVLKLFYFMHSNDLFMETIDYMFGFNGYVGNIIAISQQVCTHKMEMCEIDTSSDSKLDITGSYHPLVSSDNNVVKNSYSLDTNMILSGPNASGKTTLLKSTLINAILNQQIGCGFYDACKSPIFYSFHSYINIPDTSSRDSLFQAEARRCKEILSCVVNNDTTQSVKKHLCIMDELFSGTNPDEAIAGSFSFIAYLAKQDNVSFVLTTHYLELCRMIKNSREIPVDNYHMETNMIGNSEIGYTYKLKQGVSQIKGGTSVMRELEFPYEIIQSMKRILCRSGKKKNKHNTKSIPSL